MEIDYIKLFQYQTKALFIYNRKVVFMNMEQLPDMLFKDYDFLNMIECTLVGNDGRKLIVKSNLVSALENLELVFDDLKVYGNKTLNIIKDIQLILVAKPSFLNIPDGFVQDSIKNTLLKSIENVKKSIATMLYDEYIDWEIDINDDNISIYKSIYEKSIER